MKAGTSMETDSEAVFPWKVGEVNGMDVARPYVCVLGGTNLDVQGFPAGQLKLRDSNPGHVRTAMGGVGRNIADNLVRLGVPTCLVSVIGDDATGRRMREEAARLGMDTSHVLVLPDAQTSTYLSVLDETGDMLVAINQMDICDRFTIAWVQQKRDVLMGAALCVMDTNFPEPVLTHVVDMLYPTVPLLLDPVSAAKAERIKSRIGKFHTVKPNRLEAEILSGLPIPEQDGPAREASLRQVAAWFHGQGVKRLFLSLGPSGTFCSTEEGQWQLPAPACRVVAATGAGDAFLATLTMGLYRQMDTHKTARLATLAASLALSHTDTINPALSLDRLLREDNS
jgi:pseudouridine kinase